MCIHTQDFLRKHTWVHVTRLACIKVIVVVAGIVDIATQGARLVKKFEEQLKEQGSSREEFDADTRTNAEKAVKTQLLMDAIADELDVKVGQGDLMERIALMARQYGIEPQQLIQILQQNNQLPSMFADIRRGMTIAAVVSGATVTDTDGNTVDTAEFFGPAGDAAEAEAADEAEAEAPAADEEPAEDEKPAKAKKAKAEAKDEKPAKEKKAKKAKDSED